MVTNLSIHLNSGDWTSLVFLQVYLLLVKWCLCRHPVCQVIVLCRLLAALLLDNMRAPFAYFIHRLANLSVRCIVTIVDDVSFQKRSVLELWQVTGNSSSESNENFDDGAVAEGGNRYATFVCASLDVLCHQALADEGLRCKRDKDTVNMNLWGWTSIEQPALVESWDPSRTAAKMATVISFSIQRTEQQ